MSVYEALREVKLLEKRIEKLENEGVFPAISISKSQGNKVTYKGNVNTVDEFIATESGKLQTRDDLRKRLNKLKGLIAVANMKEITVAGEKYTVFEALMLKSNSAYSQQLTYLNNLKRNYNNALTTYTTTLEKVEAEAYNASVQFMNAAAGAVPTASDVKTAVANGIATDKIPAYAIEAYKNYLAGRQPELKQIKPNFKEWLDEQELKLEEFMKNVDIAITSFNMTEKITIED